MTSRDTALTVQQGNQKFLRQFNGSSENICGRDFRDVLHPSVQQPLVHRFPALLDGRHQQFVVPAIAMGPGEKSAFTVFLTAGGGTRWPARQDRDTGHDAHGRGRRGARVVPERKKTLRDGRAHHRGRRRRLPQSAGCRVSCGLPAAEAAVSRPCRAGHPPAQAPDGTARASSRAVAKRLTSACRALRGTGRPVPAMFHRLSLGPAHVLRHP